MRDTVTDYEVWMNYHDLQVTEGDNGLAVTWTANETRKTAFALRDLNELDQLLAMN